MSTLIALHGGCDLSQVRTYFRDNQQFIIKEVTEIVTGIKNIAERSRKRELVEARQISMFLCRHITKADYTSIGRNHGGYDHGTVIHSKKSVESLWMYNTQFKLKFEAIWEEVKKQYALLGVDVKHPFQ